MNPYLHALPYWVIFQIILTSLLITVGKLKAPGAKEFSLLLVMELIWTAGLTFESILPTLEEKLFWDNVQFLPFYLIGPIFVAFCHSVAHQPLKSWILRLLVGAGVIFSLLPWMTGIFTDFLHADLRLEPAYPFDRLVYSFTPWFYLVLLPTYLELIYGFLVLGKAMVREKKNRSSLVITFLAVLLPFLGSQLNIFGIVILYQRDSTPLLFGVASLFIAWGYFRQRLFRILPAIKEDIFQGLPQPVWILDRDHTVLDANDAAQGLSADLGLDLLPGRKFQGLWNPEEGGVCRREGRTWEVAGKFLSGTDGRQILILTFQEVTERDAAQARLERIVQEQSVHLEENRTMMDLTLAVTGASLFTNNLVDGTVSSTPGLYEMLGYLPEEIPGLMKDLPVHPEDFPKVLRALDRHVQGLEPFYDAEFRMKDAQGQWVWVSGKGKVIEKTPEGKAQLLIGLSMNIHKSKLQALELEQKNRALEQFAYTISHDLKSPLITIRSYVGSISGDLVQGRTDRALSDLGRVEKAALRMNDLLSSVLDVARLGTGKGPSAPFSLQNVLQAVREQLQGPLELLEGQVITSNPLPELLGDAAQWGQVLQNLVENSLKFARPGQPPLVTLTWSEANRRVYVDDNGPGIPPAFREKVFSLFEKMDPRSPGTGVGLTLVRRIADLHGAKVSMEESPAGGCRVILELPAEMVLPPKPPETP